MRYIFLLLLVACCNAAPVSPKREASSRSPSPQSNGKRVMLFGARIDTPPASKKVKIEQSVQPSSSHTHDHGKGIKEEVSSSSEQAPQQVSANYHITDAILGMPIKYDPAKHPIHPVDHHPANLESTLKKIHDESFYQNINRFNLHSTNAKVLSKGHEITMKPEQGILDTHKHLIYHHIGTKPEEAFRRAEYGRYHKLSQYEGWYRLSDPHERKTHRHTSSMSEDQVASPISNHGHHSSRSGSSSVSSFPTSSSEDSAGGSVLSSAPSSRNESSGEDTISSSASLYSPSTGSDASSHSIRKTRRT